jgi:hypothetical protein
MRPLSLKFGDLDLGRGSVKLGVMGSTRRTVNVIMALALAALGCGGFVYFYFIAAAWKGWTVTDMLRAARFDRDVFQLK